MPKRGPPPKPTAQKELNGNPGKRPLNDAEPFSEPLAEDSEPPTWLDDVAKDIWREILPVLVTMKVATQADKGAIAKYCDVFSRWLRIKVKLDEHNEGVYMVTDFEKDEHGNPVYDRAGEAKKKVTYFGQMPYVSMYKSYLADMRRYETQFGLTPSARSVLRIPTAAAPGDDPVAKFLFGIDGGKKRA